MNLEALLLSALTADRLFMAGPAVSLATSRWLLAFCARATRPSTLQRRPQRWRCWGGVPIGGKQRAVHRSRTAIGHPPHG